MACCVCQRAGIESAGAPSTSCRLPALRPARPCGLPPAQRALSACRQRLPPPQAQIDQRESESNPEKVTRQFGLEAGLFKVFASKGEQGVSKGQQAKQLLARYGSAYLLTSISFAIVSFAACYAAVNAGVDVGALLSKVGLQVTDTSEKVGTVAIAYAAHKALSPVRFPPTVALTPIVARWLGKGGAADGEDDAPGS